MPASYLNQHVAVVGLQNQVVLVDLVPAYQCQFKAYHSKERSNPEKKS